MFNIRFENMNPLWQANLPGACKLVEELSALATQFTRAKTRTEMIDWFGTDADPGLHANLKRMHAVITDSSRTVTFVNALGKQLRVSYNPDDIHQSPVPSAPVSHSDMEGTYAYVFPVNMRAYPSGNTLTPKSPLAHAGSGMRLYLGYQSLAASPVNNLDLVQTIYHELTHKVIGTNDHEYGAVPCKGLIADGRALKNADNYGFFLINLR